MTTQKSVSNSTQFFPLSEPEANSHKNKRRKILYTLVIAISLLLCIKAGYFGYKAISTITENNSSLPPVGGDQLQNQKTPTFNHNPWSFSAIKKRIHNKNQSEYTEVWCEDVSSSQAIPEDIINATSKRIRSRSMLDFMALDLLLHYEQIINKYDWRRLKIIFNDYHKKLDSIERAEDLIDFFESLESNKFRYYTAYLKENDCDLRLESFRNCFSLTEELYHWYNYLDDLWLFLLSPRRQKFKEDYRVDVTVKNFNEFIRQTGTKLSRGPHSFDFTDKKAEEVNQILGELTQPVKTLINESLIVFYNKVLLLSEVRIQLNALNVSKIENVFIFASHTIYLDEDLTLAGVNVAMIAPNWVFLKKTTINLNGLNGEEYEDETPKQGVPGKPGKAGGNGGDFLGVGNINRKYLLVSNDGGKGGGGQNGAKGRDGTNSSYPFSFSKNPTCRVKIKTFYNPLKQKITHYKIYDEKSCGGSGTDGGAGGIGGKGGKVTIINKNLEISEGRNGLSGRHGKGGKGGLGASHGCYFEAFVVDDEYLHYITTLKCLDDTLPSGNPGKDGSNTAGQEFRPKKNDLNLSNALFQFVLITGEDFLRSNNSVLLSFLNDLSERDFIYSLTNPKYLLNEFKLVENVDDADLLLLLKKKIEGYLRLPWLRNWKFLKYLKSLTLGKLLLLKENVNYYFVDLNNYLNALRRNIEGINENAIPGYSPVKILYEKVDLKLNKVKSNLESVKEKMITLEESNRKLVKGLLTQGNAEEVYENEFYKSLSERMQERRILSVASMAANIFASFVSLIRSHPLNAEDELRFKNFVSGEMTKFENLKDEDLIDSLSVSFRRYRQTPVELDDFEGFLKIEKRILKTLKGFTNVDFKISQGEEIAEGAKTNFEFLTQSNALTHEGRILMEAIVDEIEHLIALYRFIERNELMNSFLLSLNDHLELDDRDDDDDDDEVRFLRKRLYEMLITLEYNSAIDAIRQRFYPFVKINRRLESSSNRTLQYEALRRINDLYELIKSNSLCGSHHEGFFDETSAVGEFYYWPNPKIRGKLIDLFKGEEITLKSDLNNRHVLDKNFIRFKTLRFEFECLRNLNSSSCQDHLLRGILNNFRIEITHSGYSYHSWRGETVVMVSDEVAFDYSLKNYKNGEPEVYNSVIKNFEKGDIMLSPYATWMIQLVGVNELANYTHLMSLVNDINLKLVGIGTFIPSPI